MQRHAAVDPPEYVNWQPDADLVAAYGERVRADPARQRRIEALDERALLDLYAGMVRFRLHDHALKRWVRRGVISKAWLATGEEAVTIGAVHALNRGPGDRVAGAEQPRDYVAPMIRNQGSLHEMGMPLEQLFAGYLGTAAAPNGGRDGHTGDPSRGVLPPISHVGDMVPVTTGVALAFRQRGEARVALTWIGDGSTKTAAVHEGLNLAGVLRVPAVFIIQNNQVALGTRLDQHHTGDFHAWGRMYGMPCEAMDGNHVLDVYAAVAEAVERARAGGGPSLLVAHTFRMGGHATHDEAEARTTFDAALFEHWGRLDPIGLYEEHLASRGIERERLSQIEMEVGAEVDAAAERALADRDTGMPRPESAELAGISEGVRQPGLAARLSGTVNEMKG